MILPVILLVIAALVLIAKFVPKGKTIVLYAVLIMIAFIMIFPFYDMFVMSTRTTQEIFSFPPLLVFGQNLVENFKNMTDQVDFWLAFRNSMIITCSYVALVLLFCSIGGYAFAFYNFPGRNVLFAILLGTMMIPTTAGIIPWYIMMSKFHWVDTFRALIIPNCANAFGIYWMRQYCKNNIPTSLIEAARIDGCSEWTIFFRIVAPILAPAYASLGIMNFVNVWNDFMQPMMILKSPKLQTLPLMLRTMVSDRGTDYGAMMLASTCAVLPLLIAFLCASKYFMDGLTAGAVKE
ncbi:MAG: carbohydrate ABC transporter permease [Lachnospiraceae bacterium]|nr:carbohydrate ABC transporter permease [Lachnospiraceae bacterium]